MVERGLYYNMAGEPISIDDADKLFINPQSRRVALDALPNGYSVSTVLLVIDHSLGFGRPMIFETMVFGKDEDDMERYSNKEQALAGHRRMVEKWRSRPRATP